MFAYRLPEAREPMQADAHSSARRLLPAGPWQFAPHPEGGTYATWKDASGVIPVLSSFGTPRPTPDGLVYYPPAALPTSLEPLMRKPAPRAIHVELASGVHVPIAPAAASPRKLIFTVDGIEEGDWLTDYARAADDLRAKAKAEGDVPRSDKLLHRVVLCALQSCLRVTPELLTDLGWVSSADFLPIVRAAWGFEGKETGAGDEPSSSPAPDSPTSP